MKAPAFQLYARDFLADPLVDAMTPEQLGGYFRLLLVAWQQDEPGHLPDDDALLAGWSRLGKRWKACSAPIRRCFRKADDGRLFQKRMVEVAFDQEFYRKQQSEAGKRGNAKRWASQPDAKNIATRSQADRDPGRETVAEASPKHRSASASASAPAKNQEREQAHAPARVIGDLPSPTGFADIWGVATGEPLPDAYQLGEVRKKLESYAEHVGKPFRTVADHALDAFREEVAGWTEPRPLTASLFNRKWGEIQTRMSGKVPARAAPKPRGAPEPRPAVAVGGREEL